MWIVYFFSINILFFSFLYLILNYNIESLLINYLISFLLKNMTDKQIKTEHIIFLWDNLVNLDKIKDNSINIAYIDPPYNTWNKFNYNDKIDKDEWINLINKRIIKLKNKLTKDAVILFSISEESLFDSYNILKNNFKYVFEPLIWQTKSILNQNKVTNISSVVTEYILVAANVKINTNKELLTDKEILKDKIKNYPLSIILDKNIDNYSYEIINWKKVYKISYNEYKILKNKNKDFNEESFRWHMYQKRTYQIWHGSERYIKLVKNMKNYDSKTLYFIDWVKDKQWLNGKFILWNSYFQSISNKIYIKMPNFLWKYQGWIQWFQTAKPVDLMIRLFKAFNIYWKKCKMLDLYTWSWNILKACDKLWISCVWFELWDNKKTLNVLEKNLKDLNIKLV